MSDAAIAYGQLFGLGLPWVTVHCGAMCGPIAGGMTASIPRKVERIRGIGAYQLGRAVVYVPLGAAAGAFGGAVELRPQVGAVAGLAMAAIMLAAAWRGGGAGAGARAGAAVIPVRRLLRHVEGRRGLASSIGAAQRLLARGTVFPLAFAGVALGALPCMLPAWVLGLAATTGSAVHGAALMALLLVMNTLPLAAAAVVLPGRTRGALGALLPRAALTASALWIALGALAALHLVPHGRAAVLGRTITFW
jgi:sulfite exporter TauE/SafE